MSGDIREDIEAAIEHLETGGTDAGAADGGDSGAVAAGVGATGGEGDGAAAAGDGKPDGAPAVAGRQRDAHGRFAPGGAGADAKAPPKLAAAAAPAPAPAVTPAAAAAPQGKPPPAPDAAPVAELRAPSSWKPAAREKWASVPPEAQQEILRLDKEVRQTMEQAAPAKRFAQEFQQTVAPFEGMIRAEGSTPLKAVSNLLQTAAALRTAPPAHKAQLVAGLVRTYGIPIEALDAALVGEQPQGGQGQGQPFQDPRVDKLFARIEQAETQRTQAMRQQVDTELASFTATAEFLDDVRDDMADLILMASQRGVALSLQDAYNKAVAMNPELSKVLQQREAAKAAANAQASTQRTKAAASSVKSQPAGPSSAPAPDDLRSTIKAAMTGSLNR